jgi:hypothetical protein
MPFWGIVGKRVKGPLGVIFKLKKPRKVLDCLVLLYSSSKLKSVSLKQCRKFFNSVERPQVRVPHIPFLFDALKELERAGLPPYKLRNYREFPFSPEKRTCGPNGKSLLQVPTSLIEDFTVSNTWDFLDDDSLQQCMASHLDRLYPILFHHSKESVEDSCVGKVSVIQERGCKARFIAMPRLVHQLCLQSLGSFLFKLLKQCPWDCTHNQLSGVSYVRKHLENHRKVWSVDLSDASNNFPLELIMRVLREIDVIPYEDLMYFQAVSQGTYLLSPHIYNRFKKIHPTKTVQWNQGQPLGTYPSFPAFALAHGLLIRSIEMRHGFSNTFRILGDDVVITNGIVHFEYRRILEVLGIPISEGKSLHSISCGEFAGHFIDRNVSFTPEKYLFPTGKNLLLRRYREVSHLDKVESPLDLLAMCRNLPFDNNSDGVSLRKRAILLRLLEEELSPDLIRLQSILSDDVYRHISYEYFNRDEDLTIYSREDYERDKSLIAALDQDMQKSYTRNASYSSVFGLADACGLRDMFILGSDIAYLFDKYPEARDSWISFSSAIPDFIRDKYLPVERNAIKAMISTMIRIQIRDFKKTKATIQGELLSIVLRFLEQS